MPATLPARVTGVSQPAPGSSSPVPQPPNKKKHLPHPRIRLAHPTHPPSPVCLLTLLRACRGTWTTGSHPQGTRTPTGPRRGPVRPGRCIIHVRHSTARQGVTTGPVKLPPPTPQPELVQHKGGRHRSSWMAHLKAPVHPMVRPPDHPIIRPCLPASCDTAIHVGSKNGAKA